MTKLVNPLWLEDDAAISQRLFEVSVYLGSVPPARTPDA
jgi:hypothetical protein